MYVSFVRDAKSLLKLELVVLCCFTFIFLLIFDSTSVFASNQSCNHSSLHGFFEIFKYISTSHIIPDCKNIKCWVKPLCRPLHGKTIHLSIQFQFVQFACQVDNSQLELLELEKMLLWKKHSRGHNCHVRVGDASAAEGFQTPEFHGAICASTKRLESSQNSKMWHAKLMTSFSLQKVRVERSSDFRTNVLTSSVSISNVEAWSFSQSTLRLQTSKVHFHTLQTKRIDGIITTYNNYIIQPTTKSTNNKKSTCKSKRWILLWFALGCKK